MSDQKIYTKEYYIASLDILGAKQIIKEDEKKDIHLNNIRKIYKSWRTIFGQLNFELKIFSDNIVVATEVSDVTTSLDELIKGVGYAAEHYLKCGYKLRGGICKGRLYMDDTFVWGQGLVQAHILESEVAKYPRIILAEDIVDNISSSVAGELVATDDNDEKKYINYLRGFGTSPATQLEIIIEALNRTNNELTCPEIEESIKEKLMWLKNYLEKNEDYYKKEIIKYRQKNG